MPKRFSKQLNNIEMLRGKGNRKVMGEGKRKRLKLNEEELKAIRGYEKGPNYVEVGCGFTNKKYGDFGGRLKLKTNGQFLITCQCYEGCEQVEVTPKEFEKHGAMKEVKGRKWTSSIWVQLEDTGEKVALGKSHLMKYYNHKANVDNWIKFVSRNNKFHYDLFLRCSKCLKQRRFRRRTMKQIKEYHDAVNNSTWECSLWPYAKISCEEKEERENRKMYRGCPLVKQCQGCKYCNCTGCLKCRFLNCNCRECTDFMNEGKPF